MQILIDQSDLKRMSPSTRGELLRILQGDAGAAAPPSPGAKGFRWRTPYDLTPELARKLLRGIGAEATKRLELFARKGGRVTMRELLAACRDEDLHALTAFEGHVTRKLRRLVGDDNNIVSLIMWDYDAETWDAAHKNLVDGVYYVSEATTRALRQVLKIAPPDLGD